MMMMMMLPLVRSAAIILGCEGIVTRKFHRESHWSSRFGGGGGCGGGGGVI